MRAGKQRTHVPGTPRRVLLRSFDRSMPYVVGRRLVCTGATGYAFSVRRPPLYDDVHTWLTDTAQQLGVDGGCFHLRSRAGERVVCQAITDGYTATHLAYGLDLSECPALRQVLRTGDLLSVDDAAGDGRVASIARQRFGLKSILYCPVRLENRHDAVAVFSHRRLHRWSDTERGVASASVQSLEKVISPAKVGPRTTSSTYELMLGAVPGLVCVVDQNFFTLASSGAAAFDRDISTQDTAVSVDELLRNSDRGHELRAALDDIFRGDLDRFQGLFRLGSRTWWLHCRAAHGFLDAGQERLAVVHVQPFPAATGAVIVEEERRRLETLGRIAGSVAHEVNNALQHIAMGVDEIKAPNHEYERSVIRAATERAARVTQKLLTFARRAPAQLVRAELTEVINKELDLARRSVGADHRVSLRLRGRAHVRIDVRKLELVLINLCRNAADASPPGSEIVIDVGAEWFRGEEWGMLAVEDTGPGMPPAVMDTLGELQTSTKPEGLGSGIGLMVVKQVAEEHGGEVVIRAREGGQGTRVTLLLPLDVEETKKTTGAPATGQRILVVDDEVELARIFARALETVGFQTKRCWSLESARALFDEDPTWPDLVIFDINLGDGSGVDLLEYAREARPQLRFLAVSGLADQASAPSLSVIGCPVLSKPFSVAELRAEVERVLK